MDEKILAKKIDFKKINLKDAFKGSWIWWSKFHVIVFIFCMFISMAAGIFIWYRSLYTPIMTKQDVDSYRALKDRGVRFNEENYNDILRYIESRRIEYSKDYSVQRNIFE